MTKYNIEEVYKRIGTVVFQPGDVIKDYDEGPKELFMIFSGEVGIFAKINNG